ncbi:MAG: FtsX-like permease family protein [Anaerolineales bacterium]
MLTSSLIRASWRDLTRRGWQFGLMVLGVALGVAVVVAIDLANTSATRAFELSTGSVVGRATHRIEAGPAGVPVSVYSQLVRAGRVGELAPIVEAYGVAPTLADKPLRLLGIDPLAENPFREFFGGGRPQGPGFERFYTEPGTVIVSSGLAASFDLTPGDTFEFLVNGRRAILTVLGILSMPNEGGNGLPDEIILTDIASAQQVVGQPDSLSRIDVIANGEQADRIRGLLPTGVEVAPASQQAQIASQLSNAFQLNLTALSLLALVVGMFLIYNTTTFSVVQRRFVLATMRSLGVTADQLFALILFEAMVIGAAGALLGIALGWVLGQGAVRLVTQTINDFYFVVSVRQAPLTTWAVVKGLLLGVGSSVLAAAPPAWEAASVPPVTAMQRSSLESRVRRWLPVVSGGGVGLAAAGVGLLVVFDRSLVASFAGMFAILLGIALMVPVLTIAMMRAAGWALRRTVGVLGGISARTVTNALSRTSVAIAALMVALSVTIGVGVMIESFRSTVINWLDLSLRADLYVSAPTAGGGTRPTTDLDPGWADRLAQLPGIETVETFRSVTVESEFGPIQLSVADASRARDARLYRFASGSADDVWQRVVNGAVIVSEPFAYQHGLPNRGGEVELQTDQGLETFSVVGVYYDYASDRGTVLMAEGTYHRYWRDRAISSIALYLAPEAQEDQVRAQVQATLAGSGLTVQANRSIRQEALRIFDRTFAITGALRLLAVLVAFVGVVSALLALQLERSRELATLQALGLTKGGLWSLTLLETGLMGLTAGLLSLPTGLVLALVLIYVINLRSFGWTIQLVPAPLIFVQALIVAVLAALLAGLYPLRRLNQMQIADALRQE